jgi:hypothetical protein
LAKIPRLSLISCKIASCISRIWVNSYLVIVRKNQAALPQSPSPLLKKKLPANNPYSLKDLATVHNIVDLPVPAKPLSQKMHFPSSETAHSSI